MIFKYVLVNACFRGQYEIYFSSNFLFVIVCPSACARANNRKENYEKNKSHIARETCVNWVIAWWTHINQTNKRMNPTTIRRFSLKKFTHSAILTITNKNKKIRLKRHCFYNHNNFKTILNYTFFEFLKITGTVYFF